MADERNFRFVSPGIFIREIDRSQIPVERDAIGPLIIGQAEKGPAFTPVTVRNLNEFELMFGRPVSGLEPAQTDIWRGGTNNAPKYATYAAYAYLNSGNTPITFMRVVGKDNKNAVSDPLPTEPDLAGWEVPVTTGSTSAASVAGAFGLFFFGSSSATQLTGVLGAVFYTNGAAIYPTGTVFGGAAGAGMNTLFNLGTSTDFVLQVSSSSGKNDYSVSLTKGNQNYIRDVFNTNPQLLYTGVRSQTSVENSDTSKLFWLGETFEREVQDKIVSKFNGYAVAVLPLMQNKQTTQAAFANRRSSFRESHSPWFVSQDISTNTGSFTVSDRDRAIPLFKLVTLKGQGDYVSRHIKIGIENINYSPNDNVSYGTFDIVLRDAADTDTRPVVIEKFSGVSLNPASENYIVNKIGDMYEEYDDENAVLRTYGDTPNLSRYVRVVVSEQVQAGDAPSLLPFGFYGVPKLKTAASITSLTTTQDVGTFVSLGGFTPSGASTYVLSASSNTTASILFPSIPTRTTASSNEYKFGVEPTLVAGGSIFDPGYVDYTRYLGEAVIADTEWGDNWGLTIPANAKYTFQDGFTLDDVVLTVGTQYDYNAAPRKNISYAVHSSGSRATGTSFTAITGGVTGITESSYKHILNAGFNSFVAPMFGGFDGLSVFERDPLRNELIGNDSDPKDNAILDSYLTAINIVSDPESYDFNIITIPGITKPVVTNKLLEICEARGDAMAIIDVEGGYIPPHEAYYSDKSDRKGSFQTVANNMESRNLNNSYGAAYYPWVTISDPTSDKRLKVPPSVVALGVMGSTERVSDVWFAPAGFNRGGLTQGAAGIPVISVDEKLNSVARDILYARNINPIASFPSEGIVVFGQKTLQAVPSALDRINVRRLMIYLKKGISQIAATTLFEQNVQSTWNDFSQRSNNFLSNVKGRLGLDDYRVILDETTTTPDLVDRNILYAKVFVKPARSIEFIALDFIITRSGASFTD